MDKDKKKKVMVFGVFDGIHDGHLYFFDEAKKMGATLIAVVARDEAVRHLKKRQPQTPFRERMRKVEMCKAITEAVAGDMDEGSWEVIYAYKPDIIALGYDQEQLHETLMTNLKKFPWPITITSIDSHRPEELHSSIIAQKQKV